MRRTSLFITACTVLVALLGLSAQAWAHNGTHDPKCQQGTSHKAFGLYAQDIKTTTTDIAYEVSDSTGTGYACTSLITAAFSYSAGGQNTQFTRLEVTLPPGVFIENTVRQGAAWHGRYAGNAQVRAVTWLGLPLLPVFVEPDPNYVNVKLTVDNQTPGRDCPSTALVCLLGTGTLNSNGLPAGHGWIWVEFDDSKARYRLTIGEFYGALGSPAGLTRIDTYHQCGFLGTVSGSTCGTSGDALFVNGDAIPAGERSRCLAAGGSTSNGTGTYSLRARTRGTVAGQPLWTAPVTTCMPWRPNAPDRVQIAHWWPS